MIYHITSRTSWIEAQSQGSFRAISLESEGFIHSSTEKQVISVANAFYRGQLGLVLLAIDEKLLQSEVRWEAPVGAPTAGILSSEKFPHIYGPINLNAVIQCMEFAPDTNGSFFLPPMNIHE